MTLFDEIERTECSPAKHSEPSFNYLNSTARPYAIKVRTLLESWFVRYPNTHKADLVSRFRRPNDVHHLGAFFELYMHALLRYLGYTAEVHPETPSGDGSKPDFVVTSPAGTRFFLEATDVR